MDCGSWVRISVLREICCVTWRRSHRKPQAQKTGMLILPYSAFQVALWCWITVSKHDWGSFMAKKSGTIFLLYYWRQRWQNDRNNKLQPQKQILYIKQNSLLIKSKECLGWWSKGTLEEMHFLIKTIIDCGRWFMISSQVNGFAEVRQNSLKRSPA